MAALQRHQLPADHRGVALLARLVAPAAALRVLRRGDEVQRRLGRRKQLLVVGHGVGLAERDRGDAVRVHVAARLVQGAALRADAHVVDQERQAVADGGLVLALLVRLSAAEERQQGQAGGGVAGFGQLARVPALAAAGGAEGVVEAPAAVGHLVIGQPPQGGGHGLLAGLAAALPITNWALVGRSRGPKPHAAVDAHHRQQVALGHALQAVIGEVDRRGHASGSSDGWISTLLLFDLRFERHGLDRGVFVQRRRLVVVDLLDLFDLLFLGRGDDQVLSPCKERGRERRPSPSSPASPCGRPC